MPKNEDYGAVKDFCKKVLDSADESTSDRLRAAELLYRVARDRARTEADTWGAEWKAE